jgi:hypothetical protein
MELHDLVTPLCLVRDAQQPVQQDVQVHFQLQQRTMGQVQITSNSALSVPPPPVISGSMSAISK